MRGNGRIVMMRHGIVVGLGIVLGAGCMGVAGKSSSLQLATIPTTTVSHTATTPAKDASKSATALTIAKFGKRTPNTNGSIFVTEYHHILDHPGSLYRSPAKFAKDLEDLYKRGFRPVTATEYIENRMSIPKGTTPVVMTFDDSNPSQLKFLKNGSIDPKCAVGIWMDFAKTHEDFPVKGTFFVLPSMWDQDRLIKKKVELLHKLGSEIANHTTTHPELRKLSESRVQYEIGSAELQLEKYGEKGPHTLAFPFGSTPKNFAVFKNGFDYKGKRIKLNGAFLVGANPSPSPTSKKFNRYRIPRIQACGDRFGLDDWLKQVDQGKVKLYIQP